jgi:hypothetical protein
LNHRGAEAEDKPRNRETLKDETTLLLPLCVVVSWWLIDLQVGGLSFQSFRFPNFTVFRFVSL